MFRKAHLVLKDGVPILRDGKLGPYRFGKALTVAAPVAPAMSRRMQSYTMETHGVAAGMFSIPAHLIGRPNPFGSVPCRA